MKQSTSSPEFKRAYAAWLESDPEPTAIFNGGGLIHGYRRTPVYETWANLKRRASRGDIRLHASWSNFESFLVDMGPRPGNEEARYVLKRIAGSGGEYGPTTCIWRPRAERQWRTRYWEFEPLLSCERDQAVEDWEKRVRDAQAAE